MVLNRGKTIAIIKEKLRRIERDFEQSKKDWDKEVLDYYKFKVEEAKEQLKTAQAHLTKVKAPAYRADLDEELSYHLTRKKPEALPDIHGKLLELMNVLDAVEGEEIKVSPQIERALGLKW